jgi:hypothetical protein
VTGGWRAIGVASSSEKLSSSYRPGGRLRRLLHGLSMCLTLAIGPWSLPARACSFETWRINVGLGLVLRYIGSSKYLNAPLFSSADDPSPDRSAELRGSSSTRDPFASASASLLSLAATPSYHSSIASSGLSGKQVLGSILRKTWFVSGSTTSNFSTDFCRNGTCSCGPSSSCIVCHVTKPCFLSAGMPGAE